MRNKGRQKLKEISREQIQKKIEKDKQKRKEIEEEKINEKSRQKEKRKKIYMGERKKRGRDSIKSRKGSRE